VAPDPLPNVIAGVLAANRVQVERWRRSEPGAWGHLAGQAVLAYRRAVGRPLTDAERRAAWAATWSALEATR
jgi:hypothetical protein